MLTLKTRDLAEDIARDGCCARLNGVVAAQGWTSRNTDLDGGGAMVRMTPG
jgi:hypothetical protein